LTNVKYSLRCQFSLDVKVVTSNLSLKKNFGLESVTGFICLINKIHSANLHENKLPTLKY